MANRITVLSSILSEPQFLEALRIELLAPSSRNGISAVLRVRVNAHMATIGRIGERDARVALLEPAIRRIRQCVRSTDLVARTKPGILLILLKNVNCENDLANICDRITRAGNRPFQVASRQVYSGFNVGAAIISDGDTDPISLVKRATATMYRRNRYGDGGYELFSDETAQDCHDPHTVESQISAALRDDLVELDFQPQHRSDGDLFGAEAQVRIRTPGGRWLSGDAFLPGLEDVNLILQIGERALGQLCFQAGDWLRRDIPVRSLSLAVPDAQFLREDFPSKLKVLLHNAGIPGTLLELELTESTIMTDLETSRRTLTKLAALGVRIALRGVNVGPFLSSCIPDLRIGTLQLSCSANALPSVGSELLLHAVISQAHRLGLRVTSKDIRSTAQMTALRSAGCDGFQGSLLSRPLSREKIEEVLLACNARPKRA